MARYHNFDFSQPREKIIRSNIFSTSIVTRIDKTDLPGLEPLHDRDLDRGMSVELGGTSLPLPLPRNRQIPNMPLERGLDAKIKAYFDHPDAPESGQMIIYTDGSTIANGQKGAKSGYGVFFATRYIQPISRQVPRSEKQTNNVAELMAIRDAIRAASGPCTIYTDSNYSIDVLTGRKNAHVNKELIQEIKQGLHGVKLIHVYAHTGDKQNIHSIGNDIADYLAGLASADKALV